MLEEYWRFAGREIVRLAWNTELGQDVTVLSGHSVLLVPEAVFDAELIEAQLRITGLVLAKRFFLSQSSVG